MVFLSLANAEIVLQLQHDCFLQESFPIHHSSIICTCYVIYWQCDKITFRKNNSSPEDGAAGSSETLVFAKWHIISKKTIILKLYCTAVDVCWENIVIMYAGCRHE
jgi:hypothetical protein